MLAYKVVDIRRSELCVIRKAVAAWELPILEAMHEGLTVHGDDQLVDRPTPDAAAEYERLTALYKHTTNANGDQGVPYVSSVYGTHGDGVRALSRAIKAATIDTVDDDLIGDLSAGG